ncbi:hypothetical protein RFH42_14135 [Acinetobacter rudis]|uniref:Uncharacterized protein n=1 Tax=Acinetobacter rudis TaxID=632955 RepID=A0AAW8JCL8_9GAMM|nr:hypothetical protein [Acinetobacter rudis]MDQ8936825.1 hypothetical protein [Acinetobacter rudis]MDQ8954089.1 hypothetical protein [Acinetobacter rudis]MDQ9019045.1 hypothetical protein [Acinetobacter rudis]
MTLIRKGGFRERANRQRKYTNSENQQTTLAPQNQYQPTNTPTDLEAHVQHINPQYNRKTQK